MEKRSLITANDNFNGEQKVFASCLQAIVGAMLLTNGKEKTIDYINKEIYNHLIKTLNETNWEIMVISVKKMYKQQIIIS